LPEPGLREIRALVSIPVVGYGECAAWAAAVDGRKFGALVFIPELAELYRDNVQRHGLGEHFVGANDVGFRFNDVLAAFESPGPLIDRFKAATRQLIAKGAEAIVPGEAPLNVLLSMNGVTEVDGVEIVDSLGAWVRAAEAAVDAKRAGKSPAGTGYFGAVPDPVRRDEILDFYRLNPE
jgi:allantoin racemase